MWVIGRILLMGHLKYTGENLFQCSFVPHAVTLRIVVWAELGLSHGLSVSENRVLRKC
jgi:hypothetical protein